MNINYKKLIKNLSILIFSLFIGGLLSIHLGFDTHRDTLNYHIYNAWAFLNNRIEYDFMPSGIRSYYNPLLDSFYFLIMSKFNLFPHFVLFCFGLSYGLLIFIIFKISEIIFNTGKNKLFFSFLTTIIGGCAIYNIAFIGRWTHDIFLSALFLIGIYYIFKSVEKNNNIKLIILSGIIIGCSCGFKYTIVPFAISSLISILIVNKKLFSNPYKTSCIFLISGLCGFLLTNGFWMLKLYTSFGNPTMPQFSEIFHNDWINPLVKVQALDCAKFKTDILTLIKRSFCDYRYISVFFILFMNLIVWNRVDNKIMQKKYGINLYYSDFLLFTCVISVLIMLPFFIAFRYYAFYVSLSGIIVITYLTKFLHLLLKNKLHLDLLVAVASVITILLVFTVDNKHTEISKHYRREQIKDEAFRADDMHIPDKSAVIVDIGTSCVVPYQNLNARYIYYPEISFTKENEIITDKGYNKIKKYMNESNNNVYFITKNPIIANNKISDYTLKVLQEKYGIPKNTQITCKTIKSTYRNYYLCKINMLKDNIK